MSYALLFAGLEVDLDLQAVEDYEDDPSDLDSDIDHNDDEDVDAVDDDDYVEEDI